MTVDERPAPQGGQEGRVCLNCGCTSEERHLLPCEFKGEQLYICAGCLPFLIHGPH